MQDFREAVDVASGVDREEFVELPWDGQKRNGRIDRIQTIAPRSRISYVIAYGSAEKSTIAP